MKELSIEEKVKAKAYDKIRKKIAIRFGSNVADEIFSEYEESEDERIRKEILDCFRAMKQQGCFPSKHKEQYDSWIAWLEKQGEQKPAWSEEDDKIIEEIINDIECARAINYHAPKEGYEFRKNWLKSLKARYTWKPSDEQMTQLKKYCPDNRPLTSLYEQLKKLREE